MKLNRFIHVSLILALFFSLWVLGVAADESVEEMLKHSREKFYAAVEDKKQIAPATQTF